MLSLDFMTNLAGIYLGKPAKVDVMEVPVKLGSLAGLAWIDDDGVCRISLSNDISLVDVAHVFLHETAHHALGHVSKPSAKAKPIPKVLATFADNPVPAPARGWYANNEDAANEWADDALAKLKTTHGVDVVRLFWE